MADRNPIDMEAVKTLKDASSIEGMRIILSNPSVRRGLQVDEMIMHRKTNT